MNQNIELSLKKIFSEMELLAEPLVEKIAFGDPFENFLQNCSGREGDIILDGGGDIDGLGRFSVFPGPPLFTARIKGEKAELRIDKETISFKSSPPEFVELFEKFLPKRNKNISGAFEGGFIFLISYDINRFYEKIPPLPNETDTPDVWCGFYPSAKIFDNLKKRAFNVSHIKTSPSPKPAIRDASFILSDFEAGESKSSYIEKIEKIKRYIENGDVYQVNLSRTLSAKFNGNPAGVYENLRELNPSSYGAFLNGGDFQLISMSPEMFFKVNDGKIETRPIKGSAARSADPMKDAELSRELMSSEKERAENIMIVDLMRNDFSKICRPNSISVPKICALETLPTIHHLVSTVTGQLTDGATLSDILAAVFPGGSISGAPKIRAMEIIAELEGSKRSFYCGSLITAGFNGSLNASILIRSMVISNGLAVYKTGGGITSDSDPEKEFQETSVKALILSALLPEKAGKHD